MTISVHVHDRDDALGDPLGTAALVLDRTILLDPALAATLVPEHAALAGIRRPIQALVAGSPLTVRIVSADGSHDEVRRTDGVLHLSGGPGVPPLVAADLVTPSSAAPTTFPDLPEALREPLTTLWSMRDALPGSSGEAQVPPDIPDLPGGPPIDPWFPVCVWFPWLHAC